MSSPRAQQAIVIGAGPAGLMAAEVLSQAGVQVDIYDAMPSFGRKFLLAGIGGLNISHSEAYIQFCSRYTDRQTHLQPCLDAFTPDQLRTWVHGLGVDTFVGTSGRVFPTEMKAAPLLRAWLRRLRDQGVRMHTRHTWLGWNNDGFLVLSSPNGTVSVQADCTVLALGGASWPQLGSNGAWVPWLQAAGVQVEPLESANCGFEVEWSPYLKDKFSGSPVKSVTLHWQHDHGQSVERPGEFVISQHGVEGSLIYAFSKFIRQRINAQGSATFTVDLVPGRSLERIRRELGTLQNGKSLANQLKTKVGVSGVKLALLHELLSKEQLNNPEQLTALMKALPIKVVATRPIAEAISSAGGVSFQGLDKNFMVAHRPGLFVAGEMLDWEAPTGGYLLNACLATGLAAGRGALHWIKQARTE